MNQTIFDTSEICYLMGVRHAVFSPGSRNAPLSISFHRNKKIDTKVIVDERSAGFIALGIAQSTNTPVVLCCTSGTALLNYGPAIAEAWYQEIPLIVLSADRPPEWIDHWDGQTIRQQNIFSSYTKVFKQLPVDLSHPDARWDYRKKLREAILTAQEGKKGPVHINVPFREPFYPEKEQELAFSQNLSLVNVVSSKSTFSDEQINTLQEEWNQSNRKIIVIGQHVPTARELELLTLMSSQENIPVIADVISNVPDIASVIHHQDLFLLNKENWDLLKPDLVISIGKTVVSKNLKLFLREVRPKHWRINENIELADPYKSLSTIIRCEPEVLLEKLSFETEQDEQYQTNWLILNNRVRQLLDSLEPADYSEFYAVRKVIENLPSSINLHLANSMAVRYVNFIGINKASIQVYANRGTSGIDGTNGTTVGHVLCSDKPNVLITGDLSLFYDPNAFFHDYDLHNLYIIVLNNFGGGIFSLIPGPVSLADSEREKHFTTPHGRDFKNFAISAGMSYVKANDPVTLELALADFFKKGSRPKLLEIQTDINQNQQIFTQIKKKINE